MTTGLELKVQWKRLWSDSTTCPPGLLEAARGKLEKAIAGLPDGELGGLLDVDLEVGRVLGLVVGRPGARPEGVTPTAWARVVKAVFALPGAGWPHTDEGASRGLAADQAYAVGAAPGVRVLPMDVPGFRIETLGAPGPEAYGPTAAPACGSCRFFVGRGGKADDGSCRRRPPVAVSRPSHASSAFGWPMVDVGAWCGEFKARGAV